uniref:Uncharacterized protein n=1 Tax=Vespula pensylvanica TaxID=30213 RepID=A0A834K1V7_VESPE|nr:hypothetical protein H0235_016313 [Vespula pensylvanica]
MRSRVNVVFSGQVAMRNFDKGATNSLLHMTKETCISQLHISFQGSDTSATIISFILLMLATFHQIHNSSDPKHVPITHDDIKNMKRLERVIKKTLSFSCRSLVIWTKTGLSRKEVLRYFSYIISIVMKIIGANRYYSIQISFYRGKIIPQISFRFVNFIQLRSKKLHSSTICYVKIIIIIATLTKIFIIKINKPITVKKIGLKMNITLKPIETIKL